jgi:uncharacterized protein YajQ (UPF0234 family)
VRVTLARMEEMIEGLMTKCGLDKEKAEKVVDFLKDNASKVPEWLQSDAVKSLGKKLPGPLGGMFD